LFPVPGSSGFFEKIKREFDVPKGVTGPGMKKSDLETRGIFYKKWYLRKNRSKEGLKRLIVESEEPISDFIRVFLPENIRCPNRFGFAKQVKHDEASPRLISSEETQSRSPPIAIHFHAPGLDRNRW